MNQKPQWNSLHEYTTALIYHLSFPSRSGPMEIFSHIGQRWISSSCVPLPAGMFVDCLYPLSSFMGDSSTECWLLVKGPLLWECLSEPYFSPNRKVTANSKKMGIAVEILGCFSSLQGGYCLGFLVHSRCMTSPWSWNYILFWSYIRGQPGKNLVTVDLKHWARILHRKLHWCCHGQPSCRSLLSAMKSSHSAGTKCQGSSVCFMAEGSAETTNFCIIVWGMLLWSCLYWQWST